MSNLFQPLGHTRSRVTSHYALLTPDTYVWSSFPGANDCQAAIHISPHLGARFVQATIKMKKYGSLSSPLAGIQRFIYVVDGQLDLSIQGQKKTIESTGYAYLPADIPHEIFGKSDESTFVVFEKRYTPIDGIEPPDVLFGNSGTVSSNAFMGDEDAQLKLLLPNIPQFDMAINIFTYQPGTNLPQVEIHVMEHGLVMLGGSGIYRLGDDWFPVKRDDVIWMASYCPQWFVAMGKEPASYLYYKDVNRDPMLL